MSDPLREPTFLILAALAPQPLHGYAIIGEVADLSGGRLALRPGTLYGALDRLADEGLLESDREEVVDGRMRRYYRLTDAGAAVLEREAARLQDNADAARRRLSRRQARGGLASPACGWKSTWPQLRPFLSPGAWLLHGPGTHALAGDTAAPRPQRAQAAPGAVTVPGAVRQVITSKR